MADTHILTPWQPNPIQFFPPTSFRCSTRPNQAGLATEVLEIILQSLAPSQALLTQAFPPIILTISCLIGRRKLAKNSKGCQRHEYPGRIANRRLPRSAVSQRSSRLIFRTLPISITLALCVPRRALCGICVVGHKCWREFLLLETRARCAPGPPG